MGVGHEIADTQGCQTMRCRKALCSKGFRALGCRIIIYLYIFYYIRNYIYRKKVCRVSLSRHPNTPKGRRCYRRHDKKRGPLFSRKKATESNSESRGAKIGFRFLFGFRFDFCPLRSAGPRSEGKRKPATAGGSFCYRSHHRRAGGFCFSHHCTRSAMSAGCVSGIVIRSQPFGVR